ncbi:MAG: hypothetical protein Ct9H300mP28_01370 [Pseudomonadota bacterium]|nr:MAG: hypothetical protein Ct9H300mP28_01370 [Pseudomonadota bacterium]
MNIIFMSAFGEENLVAKMIRMKSACFAHLCLKFIDFFLEFGSSVNWGHV